MKAGDVSPLAGMLSGEGAMNDLMRKGFGGVIPSAIAKDAYEKEEKKKQAAAMGAAPTAAMKKGGMTASKRADGCAIRGKTRA